ncbi:VWA domain-containing protein [Treponema pallidum]|nr:VWA domain-containing protein [Treponema pallidum]
MVGVPLQWFLKDDFDGKEILWNLFRELVYYRELKADYAYYCNRVSFFEDAAQGMRRLMYEAVFSREARDEIRVRAFVQHYCHTEVASLFYLFDAVYAFHYVRNRAPYYTTPEGSALLASLYQKERGVYWEHTETALHLQFAYALAERVLFHDMPKGCNRACIARDPVVQEVLRTLVLGTEMSNFIHSEFFPLSGEVVPTKHRDRIVSVFLLEHFVRLWHLSVANITFELKNITDRSYDPFRNERAFEYTKSNLHAVHSRDGQQELKKREDVFESCTTQFDERFSISPKERKEFARLLRTTHRLRIDMRSFWKSLIGKSVQWIDCYEGKCPKGRLNVGDYVSVFPDFQEFRGRDQRYKLRVYDRVYEVRACTLRPAQIEVSFVVDNSGSMNKEKIASAREALAVSMLSLKDFGEYSDMLAAGRRERTTIHSEVYYFGSSFIKVKSFGKSKSKDFNSAQLIKASVNLDGRFGGTNDAEVLKHILADVERRRARVSSDTSFVKVVLVITDGCSSYPHESRRTIEELRRRGVMIFGFQIGLMSPEETALFHDVWNSTEELGLLLGERLEYLPRELLRTLRVVLSKVHRLSSGERLHAQRVW